MLRSLMFIFFSFAYVCLAQNCAPNSSAKNGLFILQNECQPSGIAQDCWAEILTDDARSAPKFQFRKKSLSVDLENGRVCVQGLEMAKGERMTFPMAFKFELLIERVTSTVRNLVDVIFLVDRFKTSSPRKDFAKALFCVDVPSQVIPDYNDPGLILSLTLNTAPPLLGASPEFHPNQPVRVCEMDRVKLDLDGCAISNITLTPASCPLWTDNPREDSTGEDVLSELTVLFDRKLKDLSEHCNDQTEALKSANEKLVVRMTSLTEKLEEKEDELFQLKKKLRKAENSVEDASSTILRLDTRVDDLERKYSEDKYKPRAIDKLVIPWLFTVTVVTIIVVYTYLWGFTARELWSRVVHNFI